MPNTFKDDERYIAELEARIETLEVGSLDWYETIEDVALLRALLRSRKRDETKELGRRDWPPWPSTMYWPPKGTPAWHAQCAKRRRDWLQRGSVPSIKGKEDE